MISNTDIAIMGMIIANIVANNIGESSTALFQWFDNNLLKKQP